MNNESKALELAAEVDEVVKTYPDMAEVSAELRRQHAEIESLRAQLAARVPDGVFAWATFDGEGSYDLRLYEGNESYRDDYINRNGEKYASWVFPLSAVPSQQAPVAQVSKDSPSGEPVAAMRGGKFQWLVSWFPPGNVDFYTTPQQASEVSSGTTSEPMTYELVITPISGGTSAA